MRQINLYCLGFAGGAAGYYNNWKKHIDPHITIKPLEYSGRGTRIKSPLLEDIKATVGDLIGLIENEIQASDFAFFGHSLGGILSYEITKELTKRGLRQPVHLFISAVLPTHANKTRPVKYQHMDNETLWKAMIDLGGIADEIKDDKVMQNYYLPIIRNDLKIYENHTVQGIEKIKNPITVLYADEDQETDNRVYKWSELTENKCRVVEFPGGHFYLNESYPDIINILNSILTAD